MTYHSVEFVAGSLRSDIDRADLLEWAARNWCHDPSKVRYSCAGADVWFGEEVELARAVQTIVSHGSGSITGLNARGIDFTISIGTGLLDRDDVVVISTHESTFRADSSSSDQATIAGAWVELADQVFQRLEASVAYATSEVLDEPGGDCDDIEFRLQSEAVEDGRLSDVFWLVILSPQFVDSLDLSSVREFPDGNVRQRADGTVLVRLTENPLDFGPDEKRQAREKLLT